jgi:hypothetical protein
MLKQKLVQRAGQPFFQLREQIDLSQEALRAPMTLDGPRSTYAAFFGKFGEE